MGDKNQARLIFDKILKKDPDNESALLGVAMIETNFYGKDSNKYDQKSQDRIIQNLVTAFQINPSNPNTLLVLGNTYLQKGDLQRANN